METQDLIQGEQSYEPTARQAERAAALRRFNLLFVYLPIGLLMAAVLAIVVFLLIVAISPPGAEALPMISGLADAALTIALLPVLVVGAVLLALIVYGFVKSRQRGVAPIRQTQRLLWRLDNVVGQVRLRTSEVAPKVARPFISVQSVYAYIRALTQQITRLFRRS